MILVALSAQTVEREVDQLSPFVYFIEDRIIIK